MSISRVVDHMFQFNRMYHIFEQGETTFQVIARVDEPAQRLFLNHHYDVQGISLLVAHKACTKEIKAFSYFLIQEFGWVEAEKFTTGDIAKEYLRKLQSKHWR